MSDQLWDLWWALEPVLNAVERTGLAFMPWVMMWGLIQSVMAFTIHMWVCTRQEWRAGK